MNGRNFRGDFEFSSLTLPFPSPHFYRRRTRSSLFSGDAICLCCSHFPNDQTRKFRKKQDEDNFELKIHGSPFYFASPAHSGVPKCGRNFDFQRNLAKNIKNISKLIGKLLNPQSAMRYLNLSHLNWNVCKNWTTNSCSNGSTVTTITWSRNSEPTYCNLTFSTNQPTVHVLVNSIKYMYFVIYSINSPNHSIQNPSTGVWWCLSFYTWRT